MAVSVGHSGKVALMPCNFISRLPQIEVKMLMTYFIFLHPGLNILSEALQSVPLFMHSPRLCKGHQIRSRVSGRASVVAGGSFQHLHREDNMGQMEGGNSDPEDEEPVWRSVGLGQRLLGRSKKSKGGPRLCNECPALSTCLF